MASPAAPPPSGSGPRPPEAEPGAIRARLTPEVAAAFDREWDLVLERAKQTKDLSGVYDLLTKWRHLAHAESTDPGSYCRLQAMASRTVATGKAPAGSATGEDVKALIRERLGERA